MHSDKPQTQLANYDSSALEFKLYYFSDEFFYIEKVNSDLRRKILAEFVKHKIEGPYPQTDLYIKNYPK
jgi:small-conductance mechanosensitive channel